MSVANHPQWRSQLLRSADQAGLNDWLRDRGSLTARIEARGRFAVQVLRQGLGRPTADEASLLGLERSALAWVREVALSRDGEPVVFAHTVLPCRPRGPLTRWLARLGNRSLGALLFSDAGFSRGAMHFRRLERRHALFAPALATLQATDRSPASFFWARRSLFAFGAQKVLVTEVFSPRLRSEGFDRLTRPVPDGNPSAHHPSPPGQAVEQEESSCTLPS
ncbi:MAG: chorismate lyase [Candidatus Accumulibacter sp. UW26]|jgi:chorismate--pyruvate lyase